MIQNLRDLHHDVSLCTCCIRESVLTRTHLQSAINEPMWWAMLCKLQIAYLHGMSESAHCLTWSICGPRACKVISLGLWQHHHVLLVGPPSLPVKKPISVRNGMSLQKMLEAAGLSLYTSLTLTNYHFPVGQLVQDQMPAVPSCAARSPVAAPDTILIDALYCFCQPQTARRLCPLIAGHHKLHIAKRARVCKSFAKHLQWNVENKY